MTPSTSSGATTNSPPIASQSSLSRVRSSDMSNATIGQHRGSSGVRCAVPRN
jgi:hypothetical protein